MSFNKYEYAVCHDLLPMPALYLINKHYNENQLDKILNNVRNKAER